MSPSQTHEISLAKQVSRLADIIMSAGRTTYIDRPSHNTILGNTDNTTGRFIFQVLVWQPHLCNGLLSCAARSSPRTQQPAPGVRLRLGERAWGFTWLCIL